MELTEEYLKNKRYKLCVIDADLIAYKSAAGIEKMKYYLYDADDELIKEFDKAKDCKEYWKDAEDFLGEDTSGWYRDSKKEIGTLKGVLKAVDNWIKKIKNLVVADEYRCYLTGSDNFRHEVATIQKYKGNRDDIPRPKYLKEARQHLIDKYNARMIDTIEADDAISVSLYNSFRKNGVNTDVVLASIDKDLKMTPGIHLNFDKGEFRVITEIEGDKWLGVQALMGDPTDNIKGLPNISDDFRNKYNLKKYKGVGKSIAEALLSDCETSQEIYTRVLEAYRDHYGDSHTYKSWDGSIVTKTYEEIADENYTLVYMMRKKDEVWLDYKSRIGIINELENNNG